MDSLLKKVYHELMRKTKEHEWKRYLMVDAYILNRVLDRIKERVSIEEFDNTKILMKTDDKLPRNINF